jgi:hypothetical protein
VCDISAVRADDSKGKKSSDNGRILTIATETYNRDGSVVTNKDALVLKAASTRQAFWLIKGFHLLMKESQGAGTRNVDRAASVVDMDLAAELFDSDDDVSPEVADADIAAIVKNVEVTGEVKLRRGKNLSGRQLHMMQETFEARQGAASMMQKIVRKMIGGVDEADLHFSPEELLSCFKVFDENGDGAISTLELRHVLMNIGGMRMSEQVRERRRAKRSEGPSEAKRGAERSEVPSEARCRAKRGQEV